MSHKKDLVQKMTAHARKSFARAAKIAAGCGKKSIAPEHLFYAIFLEGGSVGATILANMNVTKADCEKVIFATPPRTHKVADLPLQKKTTHIVTHAYASAADFQYPYVGTEHLVYALLEQPTKMITHILAAAEQNAKKQEEQTPTAPPETLHRSDTASSPNALAHIGHLLGIDDASGLEHDSSSTLAQFTTDSAAIGKPYPFIGHADTIGRIITILGRHTKNNPLLVGEPGVGKTALIEHVAHYCQSPDAPLHLRGKHILTLDLALLIAGTSFRGEFEQRLKDIITETEQRNDIILFIDELHTIMGAGNTGGSLDAANILKPALARGNLSIIGATTFDEYKKHIEKDAALARRFQKVMIDEPSIKQTQRIVQGVKKVYETHHGVRFSKDSLLAAVTLSHRYIPEQRMPDKALDVLDETAARITSTQTASADQNELHHLEQLLRDLTEQKNTLLMERNFDEAIFIQEQERNATHKLGAVQKRIHSSTANAPLITPEDIAQTVAHISGTPFETLTATPSEIIATSQKILKRHIIGQDHVLTDITQTLLRSATGITRDERPQGSFLFLGPTGVGKTLTAQILAREVYGSDDALIRIDMSEFMERHNSAKMIGAPAGYVGYGEGGTLTEKIRRKPYSVVLFDEIEKAHPDVFNLLLQILEDGRLTDSEGRVADFRNCTIIMTSNVGSTQTDTLGFGETSQTTTLQKKGSLALKELLPPELLSRIDHTCHFAPLDKKALTRIATKELALLKKQLRKRHIVLTIDASVARAIAQNTALGSNARTIRKVIQDTIETRLADYLLQHPEARALNISHNGTEVTIQ